MRHHDKTEASTAPHAAVVDGALAHFHKKQWQNSSESTHFGQNIQGHPVELRNIFCESASRNVSTALPDYLLGNYVYNPDHGETYRILRYALREQAHSVETDRNFFERIDCTRIFAPPGADVGAIVPYRLVDRQFNIDRTNSLFIPVRPRSNVSTAEAKDAVAVALREMRKLRPAERNTFDLVAQDEILKTFNRITGAFFLVMVVLASVALMVGGIGVMAIMMVSVTDRTREIGVRKALGATRRDIMIQFLTEAATLTGIGGVIGIIAGLGMGKLLTLAMNIDASTPIAYTIVAVTVSIGIGVVFGILPARRAARLDPVEALRYE